MKERGLTLIEILVALGIATVVGALLVVIMVNSAGMFSRQSSKVQGGLNINDTLSQVRMSIKQANSVAAGHTDGQTVFTSGANQLVLQVASVDAAGQIVDNIYDYFVFFSDQNILRFKVFPDVLSSRPAVDRIFSTDVDNLNFQYLSAANPPLEVSPASAVKVRISLKLKQRVGLNFETIISTSEANLRND